MQIFLITITTIVIAFLLNPMFKKVNKKVENKRRPKIHIHHSVIGLLLLAVGLALSNKVMIPIGLGIYLAHGFEEVHFNKRRFPTAFFIFVTR